MTLPVLLPLDATPRLYRETLAHTCGVCGLALPPDAPRYVSCVATEIQREHRICRALTEARGWTWWFPEEPSEEDLELLRTLITDENRDEWLTLCAAFGWDTGQDGGGCGTERGDAGG